MSAGNEQGDLLLEVIKGRRTARSYAPGELPAGCLETILEAARWSPSAANTQPWELIVIEDRDIKTQLQQAFLAESLQHDSHYQAVTRKQADLLTAPLLLGVCGNPASMDFYIDGSQIPAENKEELFLLTMGAAIQNMLLAAAALNLAGTWIIRPARVPEVRQILRVPPEIRLISLVAFGRPAREPHYSEGLRIPIAEKTHWNRFGREGG